MPQKVTKILLLTKYDKKGASSRLRTIQYIPFLRSSGISITQRNLFDKRYLQRYHDSLSKPIFSIIKSYLKRFFVILSIYKYDLIWLEKEIFPYCPAIFERFLKIIGKNYIVDYDDAIFHNYDLSKNYFVKTFLKNKIAVVMKNAKIVVVGNNYIAKYAKKAKANKIIYIPTVVDLLRYSKKSYQKKNDLIIGWIGSPSTQQYLITIRRILIKLCKSFNVSFLVIGANQEIVKHFNGLDLKLVSWHEKKEVKYIKKIDIGIMPLRNGPWEKGKCGYKLIQYMACGIPVVASPVGINNYIVNNSNSGFLADKIDEWEKALLLLIKNPSKRRKFGLAGRKAVKNNYSLQSQVSLIKKIITKAAE